MVIELETARTRLRGWRPEDLDAFAAMNADPQVMEHFPAPLSREESDALAVRSQQSLERDGLGFFALEIKASPPESEPRFAGFVGLWQVPFEAPFTPAVEVGWRLAVWAWGKGYAGEAASACLAYGFEQLGLPRIVSFTATTNQRSTAVMRRLGMTHDPALDFDHPWLPLGHPLRRHLLYRITREEFAQGKPTREAPAKPSQ
ncbi:MAG: GNAT family protein [Kiloniellales bacterium]